MGAGPAVTRLESGGLGDPVVLEGAWQEEESERGVGHQAGAAPGSRLRSFDRREPPAFELSALPALIVVILGFSKLAPSLLVPLSYHLLREVFPSNNYPISHQLS